MATEDCNEGKYGEAGRCQEREESGDVDGEDEAQVLGAAAKAQQEDARDGVQNNCCNIHMDQWNDCCYPTLKVGPSLILIP